jgi:hypothetical protein
MVGILSEGRSMPRLLKTPIGLSPSPTAHSVHRGFVLPDRFAIALKRRHRFRQCFHKLEARLKDVTQGRLQLHYRG